MNGYEKQWKKIDSLLQQKGLTESALTEVNKLYELAKKENNDAQVIKALVYRSQLRNVKEEGPVKKSIADLEKEIAGTQEPARSILQSIAGDLYWNYFRQNRYKLYNRTTTVNFTKEDIDTWGIEDFHRKISELYLASLKNEKLLQQTKLEPFDALIIKGNMRYLRPTLFDLLAHRALGYFTTTERDVTKAADAFEIDDPAAFAEAKVFANHLFKTTDSVSLYAKALQLYQRLIQFHLADTRPDALIDVDINRLTFVNEHAIAENKDALFRASLEKLTTRYNDLPAAAGRSL